MRRFKNLTETNSYLKSQDNLWESIALTISSSSLVEGVKVKNPHMKRSDLKVKLPARSLKKESIWS